MSFKFWKSLRTIVLLTICALPLLTLIIPVFTPILVASPILFLALLIAPTLSGDYRYDWHN